MATTQPRNHNLDYLRILAMLMIVCHHMYLKLGGYLTAPGVGRATRFILMVFGSGGKPAVNLFMLITGYFLITRTFKWQRLLDFVVKVYVVNTALTIAAIFLTQSKPLNLLNFALTPVFPLNSAGWWYITGYAVVLIAMPMLNRWFNGLSQREATWFMAILLTLTSVLPFFNFATSIIPMYATNGGLWMLVMYWVGAYLRRYPFYQDWSLQRLFGVLGVVSVVIVARFGLMIWRPVGFRGLLDTLHWIPTWPWADHDPMFLIWAVALFLICLKLKSLPMPKLFVYLSAETLALYMLHNSNPVSFKYTSALFANIRRAQLHGAALIERVVLIALGLFLIVCVIALLLRPLENWAVRASNAWLSRRTAAKPTDSPKSV
ncbi:acyltransferase family protein [Lacticaseibacillus nasuensis]|uniref:Acyltransferase 3 domain-containing protein n=1 Tax=Lacticaseibacillus nasuensis JCM 17158 TaxID=1291734 RepID=A0A0R1JT92_9LACO|nr:acyltransferase [Lacticaseibacillus nasuensis]KRK71684.1 hypothetical protein FD02_GL001924 [Lacticaseibacillus nasuensis JCM 17158]